MHGASVPPGIIPLERAIEARELQGWQPQHGCRVFASGEVLSNSTCAEKYRAWGWECAAEKRLAVPAFHFFKTSTRTL